MAAIFCMAVLASSQARAGSGPAASHVDYAHVPVEHWDVLHAPLADLHAMAQLHWTKPARPFIGHLVKNVEEAMAGTRYAG